MALLVFDFDGTLVDSNGLKRQAFRTVADELPGAAMHLERLLEPPVGGDRTWLLTELAARAGQPGMAGALLEKYETLTRSAILARLKSGWAAAFLGYVTAAGHRAYVSSATPRAALVAILERADLSRHFAGIYGGFGEKTENLRRILALEAAASATVVGDGADDLASAKACGCGYVRVDDGPNALFARTPADAANWLDAQLGSTNTGTTRR
jgi:phosphoglycolate phosphatase